MGLLPAAVALTACSADVTSPGSGEGTGGTGGAPSGPLGAAGDAGRHVGPPLVAFSSPPDGSKLEFTTTCRIDTPVEVDYYRNGGILHTVLRAMSKG